MRNSQGGRAAARISMTSGAPGRGRKTVVFGSVTIKAERTDRAEIEQNVGLSQMAMKRVAAGLKAPGVKIPNPKANARYYADSTNPKRIIRVFQGKRERGTFQDGRFVLSE